MGRAHLSTAFRLDERINPREAPWLNCISPTKCRGRPADCASCRGARWSTPPAGRRHPQDALFRTRGDLLGDACCSASVYMPGPSHRSSHIGRDQQRSAVLWAERLPDREHCRAGPGDVVADRAAGGADPLGDLPAVRAAVDSSFPQRPELRARIVGVTELARPALNGDVECKHGLDCSHGGHCSNSHLVLSQVFGPEICPVSKKSMRTLHGSSIVAGRDGTGEAAELSGCAALTHPHFDDIDRDRIRQYLHQHQDTDPPCRPDLPAPLCGPRWGISNLCTFSATGEVQSTCGFSGFPGQKTMASGGHCRSRQRGPTRLPRKEEPNRKASTCS